MPTLPGPEFLSTHTWVLAAPVCHVEGTFQWCNPSGDIKKEIGFVGKGFHDHHFGTVPIDRFIENWHWGWTTLGNKTLVYSTQTFQDKNEKPEGILLVFRGNKLQSAQRKLSVNFKNTRRNLFWLPYAQKLEFGDLDLYLEHQNLLSNGPAQLTFQDQVKWKYAGDSLKGHGLSNYLHTSRLSKPFFFPMLKGQSVLYTKKSSLNISTPHPQGGVSTERPE
jgi:carotenoid 1,2-hydratase